MSWVPGSCSVVSLDDCEGALDIYAGQAIEPFRGEDLDDLNDHPSEVSDVSDPVASYWRWK
jgi:hypothetical protein